MPRRTKKQIALEKAELMRIQIEPWKELLEAVAPQIPRLSSMAAHGYLGAMNAVQNKANPLLGLIQGLALEGVINTPFANSLAGGAAVAAAYAIYAADVALGAQDPLGALTESSAFDQDPVAYGHWGMGGL